MIEINDSKLSQYTLRIERARRAAAEANNDAVRQLHLRLAEMYEREAIALRSRS